MSLDLFIVTSCIELRKNSTYTVYERLQQTIDTIKSIKNYYPNSVIFIVDGLNTSERSKLLLENAGMHKFLYYNIKNFSKSIGEILLLRNFLISSDYNDIKKNVLRVHKISGRYMLVANPKRHLLTNDKYFYSIHMESWSNLYVYNTKYYSIPIDQMNAFLLSIINMLFSFRKNGILDHDLEHWFYFYQILPYNPIDNVSYLGVKGWLASDGAEINE